MMPAIRAEFRKLLTVRSTYIIAALGLALVVAYALLVEGVHGYATTIQPDKLQNMLLATGGLLGVFVALIGVLLIAHEYRYNTIIYTLTNTNDRSKTLAAKLIVIVAFSVAYALLAMVVATVSMYMGLAIKSYHISPQDLEVWSILWRCLATVVGYGLLGLALGLLFRNIVGAIVTLFIVPTTVEPLLGFWLKDNARYLPFSASDQIISNGNLTSIEGLWVFALWLGAALAAAWYLFYRRDIN